VVSARISRPSEGDRLNFSWHLLDYVRLLTYVDSAFCLRPVWAAIPLVKRQNEYGDQGPNLQINYRLRLACLPAMALAYKNARQRVASSGAPML